MRGREWSIRYHAPDDDGVSRSEQAYPGTSSKRMKTSFLCALATATMSSAPADGPPMRRTASHLETSRRAMGWKISLKTSSPVCCEPACSISGKAYHSPRTGRCPARNRRRAISLIASTFAFILTGSSLVPDRYGPATRMWRGSHGRRHHWAPRAHEVLLGKKLSLRRNRTGQLATGLELFMIRILSRRSWGLTSAAATIPRHALSRLNLKYR